MHFQYLQEQEKCWPNQGHHIMAHYNPDSVVVYQAFKPSIAEYAVKHQHFGGPCYSFNRMSWIKTSFLWMMYRSGWGSKKDQECTLAIHLSIDGFEWILENAYTVKRQKQENLNNSEILIRLQWDPDHNVHGDKVFRRAIQLGLKDTALKKFNNEFILKIEDISDFVKEQYNHFSKFSLDEMKTPAERVYVPKNKKIFELIELAG